ncbi:hypothetical protein BDZ89DRAFT_761540 [Hymenopellis radicata]|nr:hypothetical protein BDZ89DRAFT_761540 [Hymenopellis radicata]
MEQIRILCETAQHLIHPYFRRGPASLHRTQEAGQARPAARPRSSGQKRGGGCGCLAHPAHPEIAQAKQADRVLWSAVA